MRLSMLILLLVGCGGAGRRSDAGSEPTDAAMSELDSGVDAGSNEDAGGVDAGSTDDGGCSSSACEYQPERTFLPAAPVLRTITYDDGFTDGGRSIEIALRRPQGAPTPLPVILYSHGGASGLANATNVGAEWAAPLVRAGYLVVAIAHAPRDEASRAALCTSVGITTLADCAQFKYLHWDRPHDVRQVIDFLERTNAAGPLAGTLELSQLGYMGHSAGAGSTEMVAGAARQLGTSVVSLPDPRVRAFVGCSPEGPGDDGFFDASWDQVARPFLTLSGVGDETSEATPAMRPQPFLHMPAGEKYLGWITEASARHTTFEHKTDACVTWQQQRGADVARCEAYFPWLESAALSFFDAQLRGRQVARDYLASDSLRSLSGGVMEWNRK